MRFKSALAISQWFSPISHGRSQGLAISKLKCNGCSAPWRLRGWVRSAAVAIVLVIGLERSAFAAPFYLAQTTFGATKSGSAPVSTAGHQNHPPGDFAPFSSIDYSIVEGSAKADPGYLAARAATEDYFPEAWPFFLMWAQNVGSTARFIIDDIVLSGPGGTVSGSLQLRLTGGVSANAVLFGPTGSGGDGSASVQVDGTFSGPGFSAGFLGNRSVSADTTNGLGPVVESGVLAGAGELLSIPFANAPVGTALTLDLRLSTTGHANVYGAGSGWDNVASAGSSSFALSFNTSGTAFLLPEGYRADSPTAQIVDSVYIPEPQSREMLILGTLGVLALGLAKRRKSSNRVGHAPRA